MQVLEHVARHPEGVSANQLSQELEVPRATVYRVVTGLVQDEFLLRLPDLHGLVLGARVVELAHLVAHTRREPQEEAVDELRRATGEAVHLVRFDRGRILIADEDPHYPITDPDRFCAEPADSAVGQVLLAELPWAEAVALTRARPDALEEAVVATAVRGYGQQIGQFTPRRGCIAVGVRAGDGELVGALALSTRIASLSAAVRHLDAMRETAERLGALLVPGR